MAPNEAASDQTHVTMVRLRRTVCAGCLCLPTVRSAQGQTQPNRAQEEVSSSCCPWTPAHCKEGPSPRPCDSYADATTGDSATGVEAGLRHLDHHAGQVPADAGQKRCGQGARTYVILKWAIVAFACIRTPEGDGS